MLGLFLHSDWTIFILATINTPLIRSYTNSLIQNDLVMMQKNLTDYLVAHLIQSREMQSETSTLNVYNT